MILIRTADERRLPARHLRPAVLVIAAVATSLACTGSSATKSAGAPSTAAAAERSALAPLPDAPVDPAAHFNGQKAMQYVREVVAFGPRPVGSAAHQKLENYLRTKLKSDDLEEDAFIASTPDGPRPMRNFVVKFPGARDGIIVVAGHYDTKPLKGFVGANDGGSSTGLPLELANELRGRKKDGYSVWVVLLDGEESIQESNQMDFSNSMYGSQHLADKWQKDGTLKRIKALLLLDMIGDADLDVLRDTNSTPWLEDMIQQAATRLGYQSHFFRQETAMEDDHIPFVQRGVPSADLIDFTYGYNNVFWHTPADTVDKLSANSLEIIGSVVLESIRLLNQK